MKEGYRFLGEYIRQVDIRNKEGKKENLLGVSVQKQFIQSIANTVGTDFTKYKIVKKGQFTYIPDTSRRGDKIAIALLEDYEEGLVSNVYTVFEVIDTEKLLPEYLMLWFSRPEFDRYARFKSHGSVREVMDWEEMCKVELPVPDIEKQREIVKAYKTITDRIALKQKINDNLEATSLTIFKEKVANNSEISTTISLNNACVQITDGKHGDCESQDNSGYYFISVKDISNGCIAYNNARQITECDFIDAHKRTKLEAGDILFTNSGTLGRMCLVPSNEFTDKTTFQKSVAILKPDKEKISSTFLYLSLAYYKDKLIEFAHGSAQKNLLLSDMRNFEIKYPSQIIIKELDYLIQPIFTKIQQNNDEIVSLKILSKVLLAEIVASSR